jgi:hypothetical protein
VDTVAHLVPAARAQADCPESPGTQAEGLAMTLTRWLIFGGALTVVMAVLVFVLALLSAAADADWRHEQEHKWD